DVDLDGLNHIFFKMEQETQALLGNQAHVVETVMQRYMDIRYIGQTHEVTVPIRSRTRRVTGLNLATTLQDFHALHQQLYSFKRPDEPVEILSLRLDLVAVRETIKFRSLPFAEEEATHALKEKRPVYFEDQGFVETPVYDGSLVRPGNLVAGPAVIEEPEATIVVYPGQEAMLDHYLTYVIEII